MISRRAFLSTVLSVPACFIAPGCGYPDHIDPPLYERDVSPAQLAQEAYLHARDLPGGYGMHFRILPTGSMEPTIKGGDIIVVAGKGNRPYASLKAGEIIVYYASWMARDQPPVAHRLITKDRYGWILSGDANPTSESSWRVTEENYVGVVVARYRVKKG